MPVHGRLVGRGQFSAEYHAGDVAQHAKQVGKPLSGAMEGCRTARRGAYRVVYEIDGKNHVVRILDVAHRGNIYRAR